MLRYLLQYRFYLALSLFILIPLLSMDAAKRSPQYYRFYDHLITRLTFPIQNILSWSLDQLFLGWERYLYLVHTHDFNITLLEENKKLLKALTAYQEMEKENGRLKKLLHYQNQTSSQVVVSQVIARDVSSEFRSIRINRGSQSGIKRNMAVITPEGVVGRILRTTEVFSDVITIVDPLSAIDALVQRSRAQGIVEGKTETTCQMKYTLRTDDIQVGDLLISSGLGGWFPKGLPIGIVSQIQKKTYGITQTIEVQPVIHFSKLEEVLVLLQEEPPL